MAEAPPAAAWRPVGWIDGLRPWRKLVVVGAIGAAVGLGQAPFGLWPVSVAGLALLFGLFLRAPGKRSAGWLGWAAGTGYFAFSMLWIVEPFLVDVERHGWMAPFALGFMAVGLALFWGGGFALARLAGANAGAWIAALTIAEGLRGYLFTGFPWAQIGHVWIDTPMAQWAAFAGAHGLSVLTLAAGVALWGLGGAAASRRAGVATAAVLVALFVGGYGLRGPAADLTGAATVRLVQPNAPQHEKWRPDKIQGFFDRKIAYTREPGEPDLVVWPETSVPVLLNDAEPTLAAISAAAGGAPVVLGIRRVSGLRLYNSLVLIGEGGKVISLYDKHHLVPFGEYIPFGHFLKGLGLKGLAAEDGNGYSAGPGAQIIGMGELGRALPLICYEGVFPQDVASAPGRADFMLLVTNDAWFGQFSGPHQHLAQARLRSIEQGLPMVRVANTGVSAMIGPKGRIIGRIPLGEAGWADLPLPPPLAPTLYSKLGDGVILGLVALLLLGSFVFRRTFNRGK